MLQALLSFLFSFLLGMYVLPVFKKFQFGQSIREDGPKSHQKKSGTPTMGGIIFIVPTIIISLFFVKLNFELFFILLLTFGYALIGFLDDFLKIYFKRNLGLTAKQKAFLQLVLSVIGYFILISNHFDTNLYIPGTHIQFDLSWFYLVFMIFLVVGTTNAVNLTDGLDGLVSGISIIALIAFISLSSALGNSTVLSFSYILIGALFAFLMFNRNPAKIFMGDTGSLSLGGAFVSMAIVTKSELLLALIGGVFVIETLSVILQVASFKLTGKRIFKMSPIHHHFELSGWSETQTVQIFWVSQAVLTVLAILLFI
jgi:phospho-N-acetylmuramoyl-pentapeptide-transferase